MPHRPQDPGASVPDREQLIEEAYALALAGHHDLALRLVEDLLRRGTGPGGAGSRVALAQARLLAARGSSGDRRRAAEVLEEIETRGDGWGWLARLERARLARREGRVHEVPGLLKQLLDGFRGSRSAEGRTGESFAGLVAAEVEHGRRAVEAGEAAGPAAEVIETAATPDGVPDAASLYRLVELGKRMARETDPDALLPLILREAMALCGAERGFVVLGDGDDLEFKRAESLDWSEIDRPAFEVSRTLLKETIRTGRSSIVTAATLPEGSPAAGSLEAAGVRWVACVPIAGDGTTLGALYLDRQVPPEAEVAGLRAALDLFAGQAAVALDNARAHESTVRALDAAEETLRVHRSESERRGGYAQLIGASDAMQEVYRKLDLFAGSDEPVVIQGETGTGKEIVARVIHDRGPRAGEEFVTVNCAGLAETLLESELFGHERGAFTGADRRRPGLFEIAHRGTLFLDEVGDMSPRMQGGLLRVLQSGEVRRIGDSQTFAVDVRIVAATHRDLREEVRAGRFREDLFFRLHVLHLRLPPLRDRAGDVPALVQGLLARRAAGDAALRFSPEAMRRLESYAWPGNVRELENVLRRVAVLGVPTILPRHLPPEIGPAPASGRRRPGTLQEFEAEAIRLALEASGGNKTEAARTLGIDRNTLYAKLKRLPKS